MNVLKQTLLLFVAVFAVAHSSALAAQHLFVTSESSQSIIRYDGETGAYLDAFITVGTGGLSDPRGIAFGPDRNLYVASYNTHSILRFNGTNGAFIDAFVPAGSGGLSGPTGITFGPDGNLYVASSGSNRILKYSGVSGGFLSVFGSLYLTVPTDLTFGPDGNLYVSNQTQNNVTKYNGLTGMFMTTFISSGSGGISMPRSLRFGVDGNVYVASIGGHSVLKYDGINGSFLNIFATGNGLSVPSGITFGPDSNLYVTSYGTHSVLRFDGRTGAFLNTFVTAGSGNLYRPRYLTFAPVPLNQAPTAHAGNFAAVNEGSQVVLDGSLSSDPESDPLSYQWSQLSGPAVSLDLTDPVYPKFIAPNVGVEGATLNFQLLVNDGKLSSTPGTVAIQIRNVNQAPIANAGGDLSVAEGASVTLDASGSFDPDGDSLGYSWTQTAGPVVVLDDSNPIHPRFIAPLTGPAGAVLRFELKVADGYLISAASSVQVAVNNINRPPVADAGLDRSVTEGSVASLDGTTSRDPDGDSLQYNWIQIAGPEVELSSAFADKPTFVAPQVGREGAVLTFQLTVSDGQLSGAPALVNLAIENVNRAPLANAGSDQTVPEGTAVSLDASASTDPDGDALTYSWVQISGPAVNLSMADPAHPTFVAPSVSAGGATLVFQLTAHDGFSESQPTQVYISVSNVNHAPIANAGSDLSVNEGASVILNGTASNDQDRDTLSYEWIQIAGPTVALNLINAAQPRFTAPMVEAGTTLSFQLVVHDGLVGSSPSVVNVTVKDTNHSPVANAGTDRTVGGGSLITLDGSASYDPDSDALSYRWVQTEGTRVTLANATAMQPSFYAPAVTTTETLGFSLTVTDGFLTSTASVKITVQRINHSPVANAGTSITVQEGAVVMLDGSRSSDPDGDSLSYSWVQSQGPEVALDLLDPVHPKFVAPRVSFPTSMVFLLTVSDGAAISEPVSVGVTILPSYAAPVCDLARAKPSSIWPPNHKLVRAEISGVSDPNNNPVTIDIIGVTQDEATQGLGDGDTAVDAVKNGTGVLLRAERAGSGNGRVYSLQFRATNSSGSSCTGRVSVCVPKDSGGACVDDGQRFNSQQ